MEKSTYKCTVESACNDIEGKQLYENYFINEQRKIKLAEGYPLDSLLNFTELTAKYGYQSEEHTVITEDGYILTIFRIVKGKRCLGPIREPPVLLMHGLLLSSDCWLDSGPDSGLAYLISDACYDLWVGNVRGNYYGKRHVSLNVTDIDFWQFSVNEIGQYDMPATIDYILKYTSSKKLNYVGYSQGGSTFFIMCSEREGYCDKVGVFIGLEPDSRNTYTKSIFCRIAAELYQDFQPMLNEIGLYEAVPWGGVVQQIAAFLCKDYVIADTFCRGVMYIIDSPHPDSVETETIRVLVGHFPAGTSVKNIVWYTQSLHVDVFQNYDYGSAGNMEIYNSTKPPAYNLTATTTPVVVMNGRNDYLTVPPDEEWLTSHLPNVIEHYIVEDPLWNHVDVPYSKLTSKNILPKILQYLNEYSELV
ncbi:Lipase 1 [Papilio xuthus]|uniref:Lipase n=1 Tax=Papilio xuthus TaxID=66420 RepID=A0A194QHR9_PAPXU|nr:Lipase 1 [Papilio xuthus]